MIENFIEKIKISIKLLTSACNYCYILFEVSAEMKNNSEETDVTKLAAYLRARYINDYLPNKINKLDITPIKLQKSLYFLFAYWGLFIRTNKNNSNSVEVDYSNHCDYLFGDKIEAWTYGPVIPKIYILQKNNPSFSNIDINDYLKENLVLKNFIDSLSNELFEVDDFGLVRLSHDDDCWKNNYNENELTHKKEINKEDIINEYITKSFK